MPELLELTPEGLYCRAGDFHVDPWRPVPRAVVTHGHADHARSGMGVVHAANAGLGLLRWRLGESQPLEGHAYGESFALGDARVSLHPAGHVLGSAQVRIELDGEVWVVSGDYKRDEDPTCAAFEVVPCDVFITEATFGLPVYRWRPRPRRLGLAAAHLPRDRCQARARDARQHRRAGARAARRGYRRCRAENRTRRRELTAPHARLRRPL